MMSDRIEEWLKKATDADPPPSPRSIHTLICSDSDTSRSVSDTSRSNSDTSVLDDGAYQKPNLKKLYDSTSVDYSESTFGPGVSELSRDSTSDLGNSANNMSTSSQATLKTSDASVVKSAPPIDPISTANISACLDSSLEKMNTETPMAVLTDNSQEIIPAPISTVVVDQAPTSSATATVDNSTRIKIICLGDSAVGKSKLVERFLLQGYKQQALSTVAVTTFQHKTTVNEEPVVVDIWDTAGQEKFNNLHASYYHEAHACIAVFDCTRKITYKNLIKWIKELKTFRPQIPLVIAANKIDANIAATKTNFKIPKMLNCPLYFVSASDGTNVVKLFRDTIKLAYDYKKNPTDFIDEIMMELETMTIEEPSVSEPCDKNMVSAQKGTKESPHKEICKPVESTECFDKRSDPSDVASEESQELAVDVPSEEVSALPPRGKGVLLPPICVLEKPELTKIGKSGLLPPVGEPCDVSETGQGETDVSAFIE